MTTDDPGRKKRKKKFINTLNSRVSRTCNFYMPVMNRKKLLHFLVDNYIWTWRRLDSLLKIAIDKVMYCNIAQRQPKYISHGPPVAKCLEGDKPSLPRPSLLYNTIYLSCGKRNN